MYNRYITSLLMVAMISVMVPLVLGQLDINGGFESAVVEPGQYIPLPAGDTKINGWVIEGNGIDYIGTLWKPSEGSRSIDLSNLDAGSISTTLKTVPGTTYRLSFDMAGNPGCGPNEKGLRVWTGDRSQDFTFDSSGRTSDDMGWQTKSLEFTAITGDTVLKFESLTHYACGPALDNVRISTIDDPNMNVDLTGVWNCDDGGTYYIRQLGNIVWWDGDSDTADTDWANVAHGTISDNTVTLDYADVPEGDAIGYGTLVLDIISNDELKAWEKPESYGGSRWVRSSNKPQPLINEPANPPVNPPVNQPAVTEPWDDQSIRQFIDEWLQQQDKCVKEVYPGAYIDRWGRICGETETATISCVLEPDHPPDWDNYHYLWVKNECLNYYPYRVQDYVKLRQGGSSFDDLAKCKGWYDGCY